MQILDTNCQSSDPNCHSTQVNFLAINIFLKGEEENHPRGPVLAFMLGVVWCTKQGQVLAPHLLTLVSLSVKRQ